MLFSLSEMPMVDTAIREGVTPFATPKRRAIAGFCNAIPRNDLFVGLYIIGCANGLLGRLIQSFQFSDWEGALAGADINVIILLACFAGILLVSEKSAERA